MWRLYPAKITTRFISDRRFDILGPLTPVLAVLSEADPAARQGGQET